MGEIIRPVQLPDPQEPQAPAAFDPPCPACRGRGLKFLTLRRMVGAAGAASEDELLKRARVLCLACDGSGQAAA
jgi:hypothetical protein